MAAWRWSLVLASLGLSLSSGAIAGAYPHFAGLGPFLGYLSGAIMAFGFWGDPLRLKFGPK